MSKTHYTQTTTPAHVYSTFKADTVCGRVDALSTENLDRVSCLNCKRQPEFTDALMARGLARAEAFANQAPQQVTNQWTGSLLTCRECGHQEFRSKGRSLDYFEYACAGCGAEALILTETGMSR